MAKEVRQEQCINDRSKTNDEDFQEKELQCFEKEIEYMEPKKFIDEELEDFSKRKTSRTIDFGPLLDIFY